MEIDQEHGGEAGERETETANQRQAQARQRGAFESCPPNPAAGSPARNPMLLLANHTKFSELLLLSMKRMAAADRHGLYILLEDFLTLRIRRPERNSVDGAENEESPYCY
jgi:hypothetical protein